MATNRIESVVLLSILSLCKLCSLYNMWVWLLWSSEASLSAIRRINHDDTRWSAWRGRSIKNNLIKDMFSGMLPVLHVSRGRRKTLLLPLQIRWFMGYLKVAKWSKKRQMDWRIGNPLYWRWSRATLSERSTYVVETEWKKSSEMVDTHQSRLPYFVYKWQQRR